MFQANVVEGLIFTLAAALTIASAALVVSAKSLVYSAFFLALVGAGNAVFMAMLGFPVISLFQLSVYVGAAVTFILFSITMFRKPVRIEPTAGILALDAAVLATAGLLYAFQSVTGTPVSVGFKEISSLLIGKYRFALIIASLALVTTLIEAITLAMRGEMK